MTGSFTVSVPRLQTKRLTLREYRQEDFEEFAQHFADPESTVHLALADRETAWRIFTSQAGLWLVQGVGWWTVEVRETGQPVGNIGGFFRETSPVMEIGTNTYRRFWGQGFAFEAGRAVEDYAFDVRGETKVQALISPSNSASLQMIRKDGWTHQGDTEVYGKLVGIHVKLRDAQAAGAAASAPAEVVR